MPSDSIREKILSNVVTTLGTITAGTTYHHTIPPKRVFRNIQGVPTVLEFPTVLLNATDAPVKETTGPNGDLINRELTLEVRLTGAHKDGLLSQQIERHLTDLVMAMEVDRTRGGFAYDQDPPVIEEPDFSDVFQDHVSVALTYAIKYRVRRSNPTLQ